MDLLGVLIISGIALYFLTKSNIFANQAPTQSTTIDASMPPSFGGGILSAGQIAQYAGAAGFAGADLVTAVAIALAESGGDPNAYGDVGTYCCSYGLWQINSFYHPEFGPNFSLLYDPATNAAAAFAIYSTAGRSFSPWTGTYPTGLYLKFMPTAQAAVA